MFFNFDDKISWDIKIFEIERSWMYNKDAVGKNRLMEEIITSFYWLLNKTQQMLFHSTFN